MMTLIRLIPDLSMDKVVFPRTRTALRDLPVWMRSGILLGNKFHYRRKNPWIHNLINFATLSSILLGIVQLSFLSLTIPLAIYLPIAMFGFGMLQFMLFILVIHEASHHMFAISKNVQRSIFWNRLFGWTVATFYGIEYGKHWEIGHQVHHYDTIKDNDPQNCSHTIYSGSALFKYTFKVLLIPGYCQFFRKYDQCEAPKHYGFNLKLLAGQCLLWGLFITVSILYLSWAVPVAVFLGIQVVSALNQFKIAMEHGGEIGRREQPLLRSCSSFFPLRWLLMPLNISLHFEHHLNYCVPWYDLPDYHRELAKIVPLEMRSQVFHYNLEVWQQINEI
jgi:fatty acid desaturase